MTRQQEHRWYELRDVDVAPGLKRIRILAVPYDTWTNLGGGVHERVEAGAPDKSVREASRGLPLLLFHNNRSMPIGKSVQWTLDDPKALIGDWELDSDEVSQEAGRKARDGFLSGASIGFQSIRRSVVWSDEDGWDEAVPRTDSMAQITRHEIRLLEVSLTPTPAFADAKVLQVRSSDRPQPLAHLAPPKMDAESQLAIRSFRDAASRLG